MIIAKEIYFHITLYFYTENGNKKIETTDFDTTTLVPWLPGRWWRSPVIG